MRGLRTVVSLIAGALAVSGCAFLTHERAAAPRIQPVQSVRNGVDPQAIYRMGRYFQGQLRYEEAIDAYKQVLAANPGHAFARDALGVVYSLRGWPELAEEELRSALAIAPRVARLHNNLGYHLMMNRRPEEALASFARAQALQPANTMVAANIASVRAALGMNETSPPAPAERQAVAQSLAAPAVSVLATSATLRLERVSEGVWELRGGSAAAVDWGRIEISNGNGTTGLARQVSALLAPRGAPQPRLTNDRPFGAVTSRIQYVAGAERAAREINSGLPVDLELVRVAALGRDMLVRVLLGKDFPREAVAGRGGVPSPAGVARLAQVSEK